MLWISTWTCINDSAITRAQYETLAARDESAMKCEMC